MRAALLLLAGCRLHFDPVDDSGIEGDDTPRPPPPWSTLIAGDGASPTRIHAVIEDGQQVWVVGDTREFGPDYNDGWVAALDAETGTFEHGAVRSFLLGTAGLGGIRRSAQGLVVVGSAYAAASEQPMLGVLDGATGNWQWAGQLVGELLHPGDSEGLAAIETTSDGGMIAVGRTRVGEGGCLMCSQTDALAVKLRADSSIEWARTIGDRYGDQVYFKVVAMPDGDLVALGGGLGVYDYSLGNESDIDSAPAVITRFGPDGTPRWSRSPAALGRSERGSRIFAGAVDPRGGVVFGGSYDFSSLPFFGRITDDGTAGDIEEFRVRPTGPAAVIAIVVADDGGLVVASVERDPSALADLVVLARTTPSRDGIAWAKSLQLPSSGGVAPSPGDVGIAKSIRGDLIVWVNGAGPTGMGALVMRMGLDGTGPGCPKLDDAAAQITLEAHVDATTNPGLSSRQLMPVIEATVPYGADIAGPGPGCM